MVKCERFVKCDDCVNERDVEELLDIAEEACETLDWLAEQEELSPRRGREESEWAAGYAEFNRIMRDVAAEFNRRG